ncbi:acyl-CoA dehydratase activase [Chloroflexota bacterium]
MITAGIDAGMNTTKAVILNGKADPEWVVIPGGIEPTAKVAQTALDEVAEKAGVSVKDIEYVIATGAGREYIPWANQKILEFLCLAKGIDFLLQSTRTLIDLGAGKSLALKCSGGKVIKVATSGKCASGTGIFLEMVANVLSLNISDMDELFFKSKKHMEIVSLCAVFAESEIISMVHDGVKLEDIMGGVFRGLAGRVYSQLIDLGIEKDLTVVGGVIKNKAMVTALEEVVGLKVLVPENPEIVGALGAALIAQEVRSVQP